jgi:cbb3-type cytochrome oxidase subunit 3
MKFIIICFSIILLSSNFVLADSLFQQGLDKTANGLGFDTGKEAVTIETRIGIIIQAILSFLGVIFFLLMIYGGFLWMTAKGNDQQVDKAKNLITAAIIGLVIVVAAYAISYFVTQYLSSKSLKEPI